MTVLRAWIARLWYGCFEHQHVRERDAKGRYFLQCQNCPDRQQILPSLQPKRRRVKPVSKVLRLAPKVIGKIQERA